MEGAVMAFYKLMELEPEYAAYCVSQKDKPEDFLIPNIDYYWWRDNIQNKDNLWPLSDYNNYDCASFVESELLKKVSELYMAEW